MTREQLAAQAVGLRSTAETMIKAGKGNASVDVATQSLMQALVQAAQQLFPSNTVIAALRTSPGSNYAEALAVANAVYGAS